ncbi:MAG TPA: type II toxin-antitoxin system VapC family toxin [Candidatus Nanoarchaeia archaeon]|nr:type II toxin-antitoxin system VapC family toxin [Candidatus Nanoarchaeia archaeon]
MEKLEDRICLDTDFLVNLLRNRKEEVDFINKIENFSSLATTSINLFELYYGAFKLGKIKDILAIEFLKQKVEILLPDDEVAIKAGEMAAKLEKNGKMMELKDLLIGVTALKNNFSVKTYNIKDFSRITGLSLV